MIPAARRIYLVIPAQAGILPNCRLKKIPDKRYALSRIELTPSVLVQLYLYIYPGCQVELHQRVDSLVSGVNNVH